MSLNLLKVPPAQGSASAAAPVPASARLPVTVIRARRPAAEARRTDLKAVRCLCPVVSRREASTTIS